MVSPQVDLPPGSSPARDPAGGAVSTKWYRRIGFWRAVAGMGLAIALAAVIVLAEFSQLLTHRTSHYRHRMAAADKSIEQLKRRVNSAERRNLTVAERASADEVLKRVVSARDLRTIRLVDAAGKRNNSGSHPVSGTLAMSGSQHAAVLQVAGMDAATEGNVYRVWWQSKRRSPTLAAEFIPDTDGKATVPIDLPPRNTSTVVITCEPGTDDAKPSGTPILKGRISPEPTR
jgi:hypothetical protein